MRKNKILLILILTMSISVVFNNFCFAASTSSIDSKLLKMGVPQELISTMDNTQKQDIINNCVKFVGYKTVTSYINDKDSTQIQPMGTIPAANLSQTIQVYSTTKSSDNRKRFILYQNYDWKIIPIFRWTDPFGISWSSNWRAVPNTSLYKMTWRYNNQPTDYTYQDTALAYTASTGCGWNTDLPEDINVPPTYKAVTMIKGYGKITIEAMTPGAITGSDQLCGNYSHVYGVGSIGLAYGPISVSFSGSAANDSQGMYQNFSY